MTMKTTVIVGYDRTPPSEAALAEAAKEAALRGGALTVLTVSHRLASAESEIRSQGGADDSAWKTAKEIASQGAERARGLQPGVPVVADVVAGYAGRVLAEATHAADLLVVGSRGGGGFPGMLLGSVSMRALAGACCPVIVVRGADRTGYDRVVAAVDIDEPCEAVLGFAFAEAARRGVGLTVVHVWDEPWIVAYGQEDPGVADDVAAIERELGDRLTALVMSARREWLDVPVFHQVATGSAAALLVAESRHAGLLVTGARRHGEGQHGMVIGPVTQTLLRHVECPVAVVPLS
jgi:nucleotide-binding universal stress UspA family protein